MLNRRSSFWRLHRSKNPEREQRLLCVQKGDDDTTDLHTGTDGPEEKIVPPLETDPLHAGIADDDMGTSQRIEDVLNPPDPTGTQEKLETQSLDRKADQLRDHMKDLVKWLEEEQFTKLLDKFLANSEKTRGKDSLEHKELKKSFEDMKENKERYKLILQRLDTLNEESVLSDESGDSNETFFAKLLAQCLQKRGDGHPKGLALSQKKAETVIDGFEDVVNPEWVYLGEMLTQLQGIGGQKEEEGGMKYITIWSIWKLAYMGKQLLEAIKKSGEEQRIREASIEAFKFAKLIHMETWNPEVFVVLQREMYNTEEQAIQALEKHATNKNFDSLIGPNGNLKIRSPKYQNIANLRAAAARGQLYDIDSERKTVFGVLFKDLVPETWIADPTTFDREWESLVNKNAAGRKAEEKIGAEHQGVRAVTILKHIDEAIKNKRYWLIPGYVQWAVYKKVQIGDIGALITTQLMHHLQEDPLFAKLAERELFARIGSLAQSGIPEISFMHLKPDSESLERFGHRKALYDSMKNEEGTRKKFEQTGSMPRLISAIQRQIEGPDGLRVNFSEKCHVFTAQDLRDLGGIARLLKKLADGTKEEKEEVRRWIIAKAVARVLAGQTIITTDGKAISILDEDDPVYSPLYTEYREWLASTEYNTSLNLRENAGQDSVDYDHAKIPNEGELFSKTKYQEGWFKPQTNGGLMYPTHCKNRVSSIGAHYLELNDLALESGISDSERYRRKKMCEVFKREMTDRLEAGAKLLRTPVGIIELDNILANEIDKKKNILVRSIDWLETIFTQRKEEIVQEIAGRRPST